MLGRQSRVTDIFDLWRTRGFEQSSSLGAGDAAARVREGLVERNRIAEVAALATRNGLEEGSFAGQAAGLEFQVYAVRPGQRNSWRATLAATCTDTPDGCVVAGSFSYPLFTRVFVAIWMSVVFAGATAALVSAIVLVAVGHGAKAGPMLLFAAVLSGLFAFGALMVGIGNSRGHENETRVREWMALRLSDTGSDASDL
jgi:hypothetical protein